MFLCIQNFLEYFAYEVVSNYKVIHKAELPFPALRLYQSDGIEQINLTHCNFQRKNCTLQKDSQNTNVYYFNNEISKTNDSKIATYNTFMNEGLCLLFDVKISNKSQGWLGIDVRFFSPNGRYDSFDSSGSLANIGHETLMLITRTEKTTLPKPFSNCIETINEYNIDNEIKREMLNESNNDEYSQAFCMFKCQKRNGICMETDSICDSKVLEECLTLCPIKCHQVSFNMETSSISLKEALDQKFDSKTSQLNLYIRYRSPSYVSITESRKVTTTSLLISFVAVLGFFSTGCKYANLIVDLFYDIFKSLIPLIS
jgi:hypothetical protein